MQREVNLPWNLLGRLAPLDKWSFTQRPLMISLNSRWQNFKSREEKNDFYTTKIRITECLQNCCCCCQDVLILCTETCLIKILVQSNSVITNCSGPAIFVRFNRVNLCSKMTNMSLKYVRYKRVFVNNRVRYNRVSL